MFVPIQSALTTYTVHPSARDVASTAGNGATAKEVEFAALIDAVMNGGDWVVSGFDYASAVGLTATFNAGIAILAGRRVYSTGTFTVGLAASVTNHIYLTWTADGNGNATALGVECNSTGTPPSTPYLYLRTLITDGSGVTGGADQRSTSTPYAALTGGVLVHEQGGLEVDASGLAAGPVKIAAGATGVGTQGTDYYGVGGTDVALADGGTGASTESGARTNLGAAPSDATYITTDGHADLSAEQNVSALTNGLLKHASGVLAKANEGTDYYAPGGTDVALADGGTGASLTDPGVDAMFGWDDSAGGIVFMDTPGVGLAFTGTTLNQANISGSIDVQLKSKMVGSDDVTSTSVYRTWNIAVVSVTNHAIGCFVIPAGLSTPTSAVLYMSTGAVPEGDIRITVQLVASGESYSSGGSINTTTSTTWYTNGSADLQEGVDISGLFTGAAEGDLVHIGVELSSGTVSTLPMHVVIAY
jgi:hypothetical protein